MEKKKKDYSEILDILEPSKESLSEEIKTIEKNKKYVSWIQEFSKKIVVVTFLLYFITSIFSIVLVYLSFQSGSISGIDTLIVETNNTFRDIIGGYIIKSAIENAVKIGGNYYIRMANNKLNILESKIKENYPNINNTEESEYNNEQY